MSSATLLSPSQAEPGIAEIFKVDGKCAISVSEERAFQSKWLPLGDISIVTTQFKKSALVTLVRQGAFEWQLPKLDKSAEIACSLLGVAGDDNRRGVDKAMDEVASIATRVGLVHPRFDPMAIEQMPFRRSTTVVVDTSGVLQGALDFVARFLHPAARVKMPAIAQMEIANLADRFLRIRRARNKKRRVRELIEHLTSQGGQRALRRLELHADTEVERTYLLGDPLRSAFEKDKNRDLNDLDISSPIRSYADRLILEAARHHQAQSGPAHLVRLLTGDQGLARMALTEGVRPLFFSATKAADVFGQRLSGQTFHPFSGYLQHVPLAALLWELATAFGSARLTRSDESTFQISALGEHLSWEPDHAEQDLLWCTLQLTGTSNATAEETIGHAETAPAHVRPKNMERVSRHSRGVRRSTSFLRFNPERMFRLICALDDHQDMRTADVEAVIQSKGDEYRRFLQSAELVHFVEGVWKAGKRIAPLSAALRNERVEEVREMLLGVPSYGAFAGRLGELATGTPLDTADLGHRLATYRILGEVTLLCAPVSGSGIFATPNVPEAAAFSQIALTRFASLDREGHGLVATGEWLESMIRDEGIHPEVARRLLDEASETGLLRRSTEGSTTQLRFGDRIVHVLRVDSGLPIVVPIFLYRGDYLIPGKASVSLRIEGTTT
ncbi:MAG: hypothetical protein OXC08_09470 [Thiotrichales bacterium]|nr:hypothetical protein [Thiotrichales bacterium]